MNIGEAVTVKGHNWQNCLYGRITGIDGGIVEFCTPGGTILKTGWIWTQTMNVEDLVKLKEYEDLVERPQLIYAGKFLPDFMGDGI